MTASISRLSTWGLAQPVRLASLGMEWQSLQASGLGPMPYRSLLFDILSCNERKESAGS